MTEVSGSRASRKARQGVVTSDKMDKTVVVEVTRQFRHKVYGKIIKRTKKYMAHDENNHCGIGDVVRVVECRPLSSKKRWRVESIIEKAH